jgi:hypothetical protein
VFFSVQIFVEVILFKQLQRLDALWLLMITSFTRESQLFPAQQAETTAVIGCRWPHSLGFDHVDAAGNDGTWAGAAAFKQLAETAE